MSALPALFHVTLFRGVWRVTLDGAFYGDYRSNADARGGAEAAALTLRATGRAAQVALAIQDQAAAPNWIDSVRRFFGL